MKDILKNIVQYTYGLNKVDLLKITGSAEETLINAVSEDRTVIIEGKFKAPIAEFEGVFGVPNLSRLNTILNIDEYREDANITMTYKKDEDTGEDMLSGVHFENKHGDFKNDYRLMNSKVVNEKLKGVKFKGVKWNVDIAPSVLGLQRLKAQASANSDETTFMAKTENGSLKFYFGDPSNNAGSFVFEPNVSGNLSKGWLWPVNTVITILNLPGDKTFKFSDEGAAKITVDTGIADYEYIIPAQTK
jgi:hypothetical protein